MLRPFDRSRLSRILSVAVITLGLVAVGAAIGVASHEFTDVPDGNIFHDDIDAIADAGITNGCAPNLYCPDSPVTRAQMATFLYRALELPDGPPRFSDVDPDGVHTPGIRAIAAANITNGCAPQRYCPRDPVTRAQMASFLVRALDL